MQTQQKSQRDQDPAGPLQDYRTIIITTTHHGAEVPTLPGQPSAKRNAPVSSQTSQLSANPSQPCPYPPKSHARILAAYINEYNVDVPEPERRSSGQLGTDRPSTLAGLGDPNGLSTKVPGVAAACTQILSAALPSFIPSMVAPLVCVFSYQTPAISDLVPIPYTPFPRPDASTSSSSAGESLLSPSSIKKVEESARKEFVYPFHPDSGIVVVHSKTWTQHEREALYLAATRFRLSGQWSKIREMMNLHRTDMEIETEYKKLYAHRELDDHHLLLSDDEDDYYEARPSIIDAMTHNSEGEGQEEDEDADDETETMIFMKFGGSQSAHHKRQQVQHLQSRRLHYDLLHLQPQPPVPQQELQHHHQPKQENYYQQQQQQQQYLGNGALNVPPLHDNNTHYHQQQQQQQQQRLSSDPDPIRIFKKEFMIDKRFILEEIPMRI
ncbi:hypothetical protein BGZ96_003961 [Linnemannia gamsii]|uniref:Myb-like domain-containing protein n=1 Tax=Linnemannia gamsii TaxID=64522 RepID=A0ABQ7K7T9_9FUNG|nr:hypothetical protein BGZ96_003961 [Linnemannia gamsii]